MSDEELIWAQFHSATISLDTFAPTREEALELMQVEWRRYAKESQQDPQMLNKNAELLKFVTVKRGVSFIYHPQPAVRASKPGPEAIRPGPEGERFDGEEETTG